jgi:N-acetylneuraminic acid mutarotase
MRNRGMLWGGMLLAAVLLVLAVFAAAAGREAALGAPLSAAAAPTRPPTPQDVPPRPPLAAQDVPGQSTATPLRQVGPDAYGYMVSDNTEPNGPAYNYIAAGNVLPDMTGDEVTQTITLPFAVTIYDRTSFTLTLDANGIAYIPQGYCDTVDCWTNLRLPNAVAPPALIAPFWDDLVIPDSPASGGVYTDVIGTAPTRTFLVEWRNVGFYHENGSVTFEIQFHENSNQIDFEYAAVDGLRATGTSATVGIQNYAQTTGIMYSFEESALNAGRAVRFVALVNPGNQTANIAGCNNAVFNGRVVNPATVGVAFSLAVVDSNPLFHSTVAPLDTGVISPGLSVPFEVVVNVPPGSPIGSTNVTTLTVQSTNPAFPLGESVRLTTLLNSTGADFVPDSGSASGTAGSVKTYTTSLYNQSGTATSFNLTTAGNSWPTTVSPQHTGVMAPGAGISVTVQVTIPTTSQAGEADVVVVTASAQSSGSCNYYGTAQFTTFNGSQVQRHPLPEPRQRHAMVDYPANGRVYLLGGVTTNNDMDLPIEEYDARADTWTPRRSLLLPVSNAGAGLLGDTIYLPGGFNGNTAVSVLQTYHPPTDGATIVSSDPLPAPRYGAGVVGLGGKLYVIGGSDNVTSTRTVYIYDPAQPAGTRWSRGADMPTARVFLAAAAVNGRIYAIGGITNVTAPVDLATVQIYDPASNSWSQGAPLQTPRGGAAAIGLDSGLPCGGYLYVFGGGWFTPQASGERYNPATGEWAPLAPLATARRTLAAAYASNGHLLLATGGYNGIVLTSIDAVACGGIFATPTPTPIGGVPTATPAPTHTPTPGPCAITFSDVHPADYFYTPVTYLACRNVISGYADGTYRPGANMTRGQLSKVVVLSNGWPLASPAQGHFSDVPPGHPFYNYIETAYAHGIISGYADGTFHPSANVSRGQICKIVVLAQGWPLANPAVGHFSDVPPGHPFYSYIETAYGHGIISGYADGTFRSEREATRGQVAKIVYLALGNP